MIRKLLTAIVLGCALFTAGGCEKPTVSDSSVPELPTARVTVARVREQLTKGHNEVTGTIEAIQKATIAAKVTGTIDMLPFELGSAVSEGQILLTVNAGEISARAAQAKAQLEQSRRNLDREQRLLEKQASTPETVKSMRDSFRVAEAAYREAKTMFDYTTITAPFSGVISEKNAQVGDLATPGTPLLVITNNLKLQVVSSVAEALATELSIGDRLPVRIKPGVERSSVVKEIAPSADPRSRTTIVKLQIENASGLRPGQYVRLILPGKEVKTLMVPAMAISRFGQMERLFVAEDNIARLRLVRTGEQIGSNIEVLSGIIADETIIIHGTGQLVDGQPLEIVQ